MTNDNDQHQLNDKIAELIRTMPEASPPDGFAARIMEGLEPKKPSLWMRFRLWLTEPRSVIVTPVRLVPAMAVALVLIALGMFAVNDMWLNRTDAPTVRFVLNDSGMNAKTVAVIGSFNSWKPEDAAMRFDKSTGAWVLELSLPPGDHEYMFLIDGQKLLADPSAQMARDDGFGNRNSIVFVNSDHEQAL